MRGTRAPYWLIAAIIAAMVAVALVARRSREFAPGTPVLVRVLDVPDGVDGERELFATRFGRVLVRSASSLRFHRHAHEMWLPLGRADATFSQAGKLVHTTLRAGQLLYAPPYALHAWTNAGDAVLVFVTAPEDEAEPVENSDGRLLDAADAERSEVDGAAATWMLDKLSRKVVTTSAKLGPFGDDAAIYVARGRGELHAGVVLPIGARQLAWLRAGATVDVTATSPLTLLVFEPAKTTVSSILKEETKRYSQDDEELVIRDFFEDRRGGRFVDVGAGHYQRYSTTFYLEEELGWSGVAIDALAEYADGYRRFRKRTTFVNALITDRERGAQPFYRAERFPEVSSVSKQLAEAQALEFADGGAVTERSVPTRTLDAVLDDLGVAAIDLLSMDIEEHEPQALAGFDLERFHPALVCIEAHPVVRDALWSYFHRHGYVRQDQYLAWDSANWYFAPRARR